MPRVRNPRNLHIADVAQHQAVLNAPVEAEVQGGVVAAHAGQGAWQCPDIAPHLGNMRWLQSYATYMPYCGAEVYLDGRMIGVLTGLLIPLIVINPFGQPPVEEVAHGELVAGDDAALGLLLEMRQKVARLLRGMLRLLGDPHASHDPAGVATVADGDGDEPGVGAVCVGARGLGDAAHGRILAQAGVGRRIVKMCELPLVRVARVADGVYL